MSSEAARQHETGPPPAAPRWLAMTPNAICIARIALAVCFPLLPAEWRFGALIAGGLSDWLDGLIARLARVQSAAGQLLDPIADKLFLVSALLTIAVSGGVEWWQALVALSRDFAVLIISAYATYLRDWQAFKRMMPSITGKLATVFLYLWLALLLAGNWAADWRQPLFWAAGICSVITACEYLYRFAFELRLRMQGRAGA